MNSLCLLLSSFVIASTVHASRILFSGDESSNLDSFNRYLSQENNSWWKTMSIYNVYPQSFRDSDGDGVGDLNGIIQKLDHFVELNVDFIWLNPFFKSPGKDNGYDISDYTAIDPIYGTMDDFDNLMREMKKRGLKFMMDFVINHVSIEHEWFKKSKENIEPYSDYFIWKDPKGYDSKRKPIPPNNWLSDFHGSAWTWEESRKQFYYRVFSPYQADLNFRNPRIFEALKQQLRFWLDKGVMGIRIDAAKYIYEDEKFLDEPYLTEEAAQRKSPFFYDMNHIYTTDLIESYEVCKELKEFIEKEYTSKDGIDRVIIVEVYASMNYTLLWYNYVHLAYNFEFVTIPLTINAASLDILIKSWLVNTPNEGAQTWMTENHDNYRKADVFGEEFIDIMNILVTLLPGNICIYYGQEIGMTGHRIRPDRVQDKVRNFRDSMRTPMQWDETMNAGFTSNHRSWLPINSNFWRINVENERGSPISHFNIFKKLMNLRKSPVSRYGRLDTYVHSEYVYIFSRTYKNESIVAVLNIGIESEIVDLSIVTDLPANLKVLVPSINAGYQVGDITPTKQKIKDVIILRPKSGLVLTTKFDEHSHTEDKTEKPHVPPSSASEISNGVLTCLTISLLFQCIIG